jgi:hypothetical protein
MAYYFPEGAKLSFSTTFAAARTITALTNANPAVATAAAHGYMTGGEILLSSGWDDATDSVYRVTTVDASTFSIQGLNATNTAIYPTGSGIGSARLISAWQEIPQVLSISTQGGDARFTTVSPLGRRNDLNVPVGFNAMSMEVVLGHDPTSSVYTSMLDISRTLTPIAFRLVLASSAATYGYGFMSVREAPALQKGQANQVTASVTFMNRVISYA